MRINTTKIPKLLSSRQQWVLWRTVERGGKPTKIPFQVNDIEAKSNDSTTWNTFEEVHVRYVAGGFDGIGYVFSEDDPYCGIDLDGCRDPKSGKVAEWARQIILDFATYAEVSPSETGVKLFGIGKSPLATGKKKELTEDKFGDKNPAIEVYDHKRYFALTGKQLRGMPDDPIDCQRQLEALCATHWPVPGTVFFPPVAASDFVDRARKYVAKMSPAISGSGGHNAAFKVACVLVLGFELSENDARAIFVEYNQRCDPPWSEREITHKLQSASRQPGQRGYLRNAVPEQFPRIRVPDYQWKNEHEPQCTNLAQATQDYLARIRKDGWKLLEIGVPELDHSLGGGVEFGEVIIIGGRPGHGKSVFGLQAIHTSALNGYPCLIVSEEMSSLALGKRTIQYATEVPEEYWRMQTVKVDEDLEKHFAVRSPVHIAEGCGSIDKVVQVIEQNIKQNGVRVVAVDYLQLIRGRGTSRFDQIANTSVTLRQLTNEHGILLIALCQLNREIEKRNRFVPQSSDLRECGQIEQDADAVVFVVWPHRINSQNPPNEYQFFVSKNRNRAINQSSFKCRFEPSRQRLVESNEYASDRSSESPADVAAREFYGPGASG